MHRFRTRRTAILAVVILGAVLRVWAAWQLPVDFDEPVYLAAGFDYAQAIQNRDLNTIIDYSGNSEHPPLVKLLYGVAILFEGNNPGWESALLSARLVSVVFGTLAVWMLALINPIAGALLAVQTTAVKYTSQAYLEALPLFAALAAIVAILRSKRSWDGWFWLSAMSLGLVVASKYSYFPVVVVLLFLFLVEKRFPWKHLLIYFGAAALFFVLLDPALWHNPVGRLTDSLFFHTQYARSTHVQQSNYGWYQPFIWLARSMPAEWHPEVYFYLGFDGIIFWLAVFGLRTEWHKRLWVLVWLISGLSFLLLWPTKWPQYTLVVIPAVCLAASETIPQVVQWFQEQEEYWNWFSEMIPKPTRVFWVVLILFVGLITFGGVVSTYNVIVGRMGWTHISEGTQPLPDNLVNTVAAGRDGSMLIGTGNGAAIWTPAGDAELLDRWQVFTSQNSGLPDDRVFAILQTHDGVIWFGTRYGLASYDGSNWRSFRGEDFGLPEEEVHALAQDLDGRLWIGTNNGLAVYDGSRFQAFTTENSELLSGFIFALAIQPRPSGQWVWIGNNGGLSRLDLTNQEWTSFTSGNSGINPGAVSGLMIDSKNRLWVTTLGGGLGVWDGQNWTQYRISNSELPYNSVQAIFERSPGEYWIASSIPNSAGGLVSRLKDGHWQTFLPNRTGYSGSETVSIAVDPSGRLWFATLTAGLDIYSPDR